MSESTESDAASPNTEGHGDHWTAALPERESDTVEELLRWVCEKGTITDKATFAFRMESGGARPEKACGIVHPDTPLRFFLLVISDSSLGEQRNEVASGYPYFADGSVNRIRVDKITVWKNGIEGIIHGTMRGGQSVNFFDADFFKNHDVYQVGKAYDFSVAGLAYKLRKATQNKIVVKEGLAVDLERERVLEEDPSADISKITSVELSLEQLRFLICDDRVADDAEFRTVVEEAGYFEAAGVGYYRVRAVMTCPNDCEFQGFIYASEGVLHGYRPQKGDSIEGWLWLQGRLISEIAYDSVPEIEREETVRARRLAAEKAEELLAGRSAGIVALGRTLTQWGGEIQICESKERDAPVFLFTYNQETWEVWVCCQTETEQTTGVYPDSERERLSKLATARGHGIAFAFVKCKDLGHGIRVKMDGLDELKQVTGGNVTLAYIKK